MLRPSRFRAALLALLLLGLPSVLLACSVPVFRYALERWPADAYEVLVFHKGELTGDQQALLERLQAGSPTSNVRATAVNLDDPAVDAELVATWQAEGDAATPRLFARYPSQASTAWSGEFNDATVDQLLDSPVRQEITRRILKGNTAVWILLESGDAAADEAAMKLLEERLAHEQATLKLPEIDQQDVKDGLVSIDPSLLQIQFSTIRLSRNDPAEQALVGMLLGSEDDLRELNEPMAFPVFGRGRVLYALIGAGINEDTIATGCAELIGPCTCQIKEQNPGTDLVMTVDWDSVVVPQSKDKALPPLTGLAGFSETPAAEPIEVPMQAEEPTPEERGAKDGQVQAVAVSEERAQDPAEAAAPARILVPQELSESFARSTESSGGRGLIVNLAVLIAVAAVLVGATSAFVIRKKG